MTITSQTLARRGGIALFLYEEQQGRCCYCDLPMKKKFKGNEPLRASKDHVIPLSQGGKNEFSNYALSHVWCNSFRGNVNWLLFKSLMRREFDEALVAFPEERKYIEKIKRRYTRGELLPFVSQDQIRMFAP